MATSTKITVDTTAFERENGRKPRTDDLNFWSFEIKGPNGTEIPKCVVGTYATALKTAKKQARETGGHAITLLP